MKPYLWYGRDLEIQLRDIRINRKGIVLNDPSSADHNNQIFEKFNDKIKQFRRDMYDDHKNSAVAPLIVDLNCGNGIIYVNPPGITFDYIDGTPKPYDAQNFIQLRGSLHLGFLRNPLWSGNSVLTMDGIRVNQTDNFFIRGFGDNETQIPKHGLLIRQKYADEGVRQPWGAYNMIQVEGGFENSAVEIVSAEEITINYLTSKSLKRGTPALHIAIDSDSRNKNTDMTMTNFHMNYGHLSTINNPVVVFDGFVGGQISLRGGVLNIKETSDVGIPHTLINKGSELRTLFYGMRHDRGPRPESNHTGVDASQGKIQRFFDGGFTHHDRGAELVNIQRFNPTSTTTR